MTFLFSLIKDLKILLDKELKRIYFVAIVFVLSSSLDLIGLGLIGAYLAFIVNPDGFRELEFLGYFNDALSSTSDQELLVLFGLILMFVFLIRLLAILLSNYIIYKFSADQMVNTQERMINIYLNQDYESFIQRNSSEYVVAVSGYVKRYRTLLRSMLKIFSDLLVCIAVVSALAVVDLETLGVLIFLFLTMFILFNKFLYSKVQRYGEEFNRGNELMIKNAKNNNLILIEDGAESLGSSVGGKKVGSISDATIFSFCGNKVLTTGEGGAVVTNSREIYDKIKLIRSHGRLDQDNYFNSTSMSQYLDLGYNWRMSSITAALGLAQLNKLEKIIKMRKNNAQYLSSKLAKFTQIKVPTPPNGYEHIYQMYTIRLPDRITRDSLHNFLTARRIFSKVYFTPIHTTSFYQQKFMVDGNSLPITEKISQQVLTLPLYPNMTMEEKELLVQTISEFFESQ